MQNIRKIVKNDKNISNMTKIKYTCKENMSKTPLNTQEYVQFLKNTYKTAECFLIRASRIGIKNQIFLAKVGLNQLFQKGFIVSFQSFTILIFYIYKNLKYFSKKIIRIEDEINKLRK